MYKKGFMLKSFKVYGITIIGFLVSFLFVIAATSIAPSKNVEINVPEVFAKSNEQINENYERVFVSKVIDGDTFETKNGEVIRVIGINAPEDTKEKERLGKDATLKAKKLLEKEYVYLSKDTSDKDKYGRSLRVVWLTIPNENEITDYHYIQDNNFAGIMLKEGLAKPMSIEPDIYFKKYYQHISMIAKENKIGIWAFNSITNGDF